MPGEGPIVVRTAPPSALFGLGDRIVQTENVLIPPLLELASNTEEDGADVAHVYYLLRRYHTAFPPAVQAAIEPIRAKVEAAGDISTLTEDELRTVRTLNYLFNTDADAVFATTTVPSA